MTHEKLSNDYSLIMACYHEAAHALLAIHNYFDIISIQVKQGSGQVLYDYYIEIDDIKDKRLAKILAFWEAEICYAGLIAEKILHKNLTGSKHTPRVIRTSSKSDIKEAADYIADFKLAKVGKARVKLKKRIEKKVENLLLDNWNIVTCIAHQLYERKSLNSHSLMNVILENANYIYRLGWEQKYNKIDKLYSSDYSEEEILKFIS